MGKYILQTDSESLDIEYMLVKEQLKRGKYIFDYKEIDTKSLMNIAEKDDIPIGDIPFVTKFLKEAHGIDKENPIEIPEYLRTEEFLKRNYAIVTWDKIPRTGSFFLKDVSVLKNFGNTVNASYTDIDNLFEYTIKSKYDTSLVLDKTHLFQVSELFNIKSEYRVYVCRGEIEAISNYNGDVTLLPDMELIKKAVNLINYNEKWLKSYTKDVMGGTKGTAIIEDHNFASVGLYNTLWGSSLIYAYRDGIDYLINDNKPIKM